MRALPTPPRARVTLLLLALAAPASSIGCGPVETPLADSGTGTEPPEAGGPDAASAHDAGHDSGEPPADSGAEASEDTGADSSPQDSAPEGQDAADTGPTVPLCLSPPLQPPIFTPGNGATAVGELAVSLTDPNVPPPSGLEQIFYTTDGTTPTTASQVYLGPIELTNFGAFELTTEIIAIVGSAVPGCPSSPPADATYTIFQDVVVPISTGPTLAALNGTTQNNDFLVTVTDADNTQTLCYTLNGTQPACDNGVCTGGSLTYDDETQIPIDSSVTNPSTGAVTIEAIACKAGDFATPASVLTATLQAAAPAAVDPSPGSSFYSVTGIDPMLSTDTVPSAAPSIEVIRATLAPAAPPTCDVGTIVGAASTGGVPNAGTFAAAFGVPITSTTTIQARVCKTGYAPSPVTSFTYTVTLNPPALPAFGNIGAPGTYDYTFSTFSFTSDGTAQGSIGAGAGATLNDPNAYAPDYWLCYTLDGTAPACGALLYRCANQTDQLSIAVDTAAPDLSVPAPAATLPAGSVQGNVTVHAVACSDELAPSGVTTGVYVFQLKSPALWSTEGAALGVPGPGCIGAPYVCIDDGLTGGDGTVKVALTAVAGNYAIPAAAVGTFTAGVQQDFGITPLATPLTLAGGACTGPLCVTPAAFMPYDFACASATGPAACGPLGPTATCAGGTVISGPFNTSAGASLGPPDTVQVGQTWSIQGCCALTGGCDGAFGDSVVSTVVFREGS